MISGLVRYSSATFKVIAGFCTGLVLSAVPSQAHPHVFVDGGVDFVISAQKDLSALRVTWLYDAFESLFILSSLGISPNAADQLEDADRQALIEHEGNWSDDFEGSAHLSVDGQSIAMERPVDMGVDLIDGRLQVTFTRNLKSPVNLGDATAEVAFYEATYFYAFAATRRPQVFNAKGACLAEVAPFSPDAQDAAMQAALSILSKEETPQISQVGALFADKIVVRCE